MDNAARMSGSLGITAKEFRILAEFEKNVTRLGRKIQLPPINFPTWTWNHRFAFEDTDAQFIVEKSNEYWETLLLCSAIYLVVVFSVKNLMTARKSFSLRVPLILWNWGLALFSIFGAIRMVPYTAHILLTYGSHHSVCIPSIVGNRTCTFWIWVFGLSKLVEFGDTVFIVLRKQQLIFLHWYHHITVLLYTFYSFSELAASGHYFVTLNYVVHSVMYTYYALRAMRVKVSKSVAMSITVMQVVQMMCGITVNWLAYSYKSKGIPCVVTHGNIYASFAMYFSYFVLFLNFFFKAYFNRSSVDKWAPKRKDSKAAEKKSE